MLLLCLIAVLSLYGVLYSEASISVNRCQPSTHICEGICPKIPFGVELPFGEGNEGLCLKDRDTGACVCWLQNPFPKDQHMQTLFKCDVASTNGTLHHMMCLPPQICFPPGSDPGCMIVLDCPCALSTHATYRNWKTVEAFILRSNTPVNAKEGGPEKTQGDVREFSLKHLLFLLAFVIAPLLCWCLLTFFHEGKCRKKTPSSSSSSPQETEPMPTDRNQQEVEEQVPCAPPVPSAPKFESPPPYREQTDLGESCLLAAECGPPPTYEDAIRDARRLQFHSEADSE